MRSFLLPENGRKDAAMNKTPTRSAFPLYIQDMERAIKFLSAEEGWLLMQALVKLSKGEPVDEDAMSPVTQFAYSQMGEKLLRDAQRYDETCERNRQNALKSRRRPPQDVASRSQPKESETVNEKEEEEENETVSETDAAAFAGEEHTHLSVPQQNKKDEYTVLPFVPPTELDVREYVFSLGKHIDVRKFLDYNRSRGWMVGQSPMQDWKAAVRNWVAKEEELSRKVASVRVHAQQYQQRQYTDEEMRFDDDKLMREAVELAKSMEI